MPRNPVKAADRFQNDLDVDEYVKKIADPTWEDIEVLAQAAKDWYGAYFKEFRACEGYIDERDQLARDIRSLRIDIFTRLHQ